jgi:hypothetical protein
MPALQACDHHPIDRTNPVADDARQRLRAPSRRAPN